MSSLNLDRYSLAHTSWRFSLSTEMVVIISACLARPGMVALSMNIMVGGLWFNSMRCQIFLTTHTQLAVSSSVGQYCVSALFRVWDRKRIGSMAVLGGYRPPGCMFGILAVSGGSMCAC